MQIESVHTKKEFDRKKCQKILFEIKKNPRILAKAGKVTSLL